MSPCIDFSHLVLALSFQGNDVFMHVLGLTENCFFLLDTLKTCQFHSRMNIKNLDQFPGKL